MTIKEMIIDLLMQDDEALTQIEEYLKLPPSVNISRLELENLLNEMIIDGYIVINKKWKTEKNEYPYSLTEKGRELHNKKNIYLKNDRIS